ncbi:hypothetical protein [Streptosporangium sp. NPDC000509]|uniref:hypothetical protein n=1 Tax=Streptosporangium sp. NPDC000509 TaxID=3366186 RepID=UPI00369CB407
MDETAVLTGYPHAPVWAVLATALMAVLGFVNHRRFRGADAQSAWAERYFDEAKPKEWRNLPFAQLPGAIMFSLWAVLLAYTWVSGQEILDALVGLGFLGSFVFGGIAVKRLYRPPAKARPAWLVAEEERRRRLGLTTRDGWTT